MQKAPKIEIDHSKCVIPFDCKECLLICPQALFTVEPVKVERFKETDPKEPGTFKLEAESRYQCTGCEKCIQVCPEDAITITWPQG